ncbi:MAG: AMP-binding protein [Anaerolineales bacterium]|nr:AMP-binding protein [Anaerolineales bacterium]
MEFYRDSDRTLGKLAKNQADRYGEQVFILSNNDTITYRMFNEMSSRIANSLSRLGIKKGDKVALLLDNSVDFLYVWFGIAKLGAIEVPVNTELKGEMLRHTLTHSDSILLITEAYYLDRIAFFAHELPSVHTVIIYPDIPAGRNLPSPLSVIGYPELLKGDAAFPEVEIEPSDLMAIMYTSGTTGPAKGVMLSHEYAFHFSEQKVKHMHSGPQDVIYNCYPMHNATGQFETTLAAMIAGGAVAHDDRFSASRFWKRIRFYGATEFVYMGGILSILHKQPATPDDADNRVRAAYGCPTPRDIQRDFEERFDLVLIEVYGSTEAGPVTFNPYDSPRVGSCGKPTSGYDVRIVDDYDRELPQGEIGEVVIRPNHPFSMFSGYYKMPELMVKVSRNFWYHSGDLAYYDSDGYMFFSQRKKHAIRKKGYMISSWDIEQTAARHPAVLEVAVVGLPEELGEEEIKLSIVLVENQQVEPVEIWRYLSQRLAYYMVPRFIEFKQAFSKTPTQRIEKYLLQEEGITPDTWDALAHGLEARRERHTRTEL